MARNFQRSAVRSGPRRQTLWGGSVPQTSQTSLAAATKQLFATFSVTTLETFTGVPATMIRNRGVLSIQSDQEAGDEAVHGAIGMAIVQGQAAAAGVASIPGPVTDSDWDGWALWMPFVHSLSFLTAASANQPAQSVFHYDSKAMRKINDNEAVVFVIENENAAFGLLFNWVGRTLFKLH